MNKQMFSQARRAWLAAGGVCAWASWVPAPALAASPAPVVTILDGEAVVVQGIAKLAVVEGLRLAPGAILITSPSARLLRIEGPAGELLSLGPRTELMLSPRLTGRGAARGAPWGYLLRGWVKTNRAFISANWDVNPSGGELVAAWQDGVGQLFVESGTASLTEPGGAPMPLTAGTFVERKAGAKLVAGRPSPAFVSQMPRPFLDSLPLRAAQFAQTKVEAKALGAPSYAELKAWLSAEPTLRQALMKRWQPLVQGEFRRSLEQNLVAHPEWERLLYPERFLPKPLPKPSF